MVESGIDVSVIVITYNQQDIVSRTLDSILAQRHSYAMEIIIGEDASSDSTRAVCQSYVDQYPDLIRLMPQAPNKGVLRNYADCAAACKGKYVASCAGDDWWHNPTKIQMQVEYLEANERCVMVYTNYDIYRAGDNKIIKDALPAESFDSSGVTDKLLLGFFLPSLTIMYRRDMLQYVDLQMFAQKGYRAEDLPMYLIFSTHGSIDCLNISTSTYTSAAGSLSNFDNAPKFESFMLNMRDIKLDFIDSHPDATQITKDKIIDLYNHIVYNGAFALQDRALVKAYAKKITKKSYKEVIKYSIFTVLPLFYLYRFIKTIS